MTVKMVDRIGFAPLSNDGKTSWMGPEYRAHMKTLRGPAPVWNWTTKTIERRVEDLPTAPNPAPSFEFNPVELYRDKPWSYDEPDPYVSWSTHYRGTRNRYKPYGFRSQQRRRSSTRMAPMTSATVMRIGDRMNGKNGLYEVIKMGRSQRWKKVTKSKGSRRRRRRSRR